MDSNPWNCEYNWSKRVPTGTDGWLCFGLERSQYVPFWCFVGFLALACTAVRALWEFQAAMKEKKKSKPAGRQRNPSVNPTPNSLEAGLLNGASAASQDVVVDTERMASICSENGISNGLEAASLAVAVALQRRRSYASVTVGVALKNGHSGHHKEVNLELDVGATPFMDLLRAADKELQAVMANGFPASSSETPELLFSWDRKPAGDMPQGHWMMQVASPTKLQVFGSTLQEERAFSVLFEACAANPNGNLWELPAAAEADLQAAHAWGTPQMDFAAYRNPASGKLRPIPELVAGLPINLQADAIAGDGFQISHEELRRRSNIISSTVSKAALQGRSKCVILYLPRGEAIAPSFLGALQAGFQVVPVDVHWPTDRAVGVTEDSNASAVLVDPSSQDAWNSLGLSLPVICVDETLFESGEGAAGVHAKLDQDDPAIMLFTSGSTGKPKGIMLSHGYVTGLAAGVADWKRVGAESKTLCYHSPTWMPFIDYLFAPLLKGGCCLYFPQGATHVVKPVELSDFANRHGATNCGFVPAMLDIFLEDGLPQSFTDVGVGGAAVPAELCKRVITAFRKGGALYQGYSGTEIGDVTAVRMLSDADVDRWANEKGFMGAARPHAGQRLAILDEAQQLVGPGGTGEITVSGPVLASGYLNLPDKTAETFLPSCAALGGARAARSGDLAMWTESGSLKVVGRRDAMVKVRGARVELGEVETAVASHPAVKSTVVTVYEDQLVAYVVPAVPANLRDHCKERLVAYMVPHIFEGIEELPRLPNGKINKKALPTPAERTDGAETVMELDSLGQMRKFTRRNAAEDRILDNVRAILIGMVIQSHATPLPAGAQMFDIANRSLGAGATWGPWQLWLLQVTRGGGWSSLAFLNGFDDTRGMKPYGFTYREPLFLVLWLILDFNWTMWYLPVFVYMKGIFNAAHWLGIPRLHMFLFSQIWILLPAFVDFYAGWQPWDPNGSVNVCTPGCYCPFDDLPWLQTVLYYTMGWWVSFYEPQKHSMLGHALIFIPCYWLGFYFGAPIFKFLTKVADEPSKLKKTAIAAGVLGFYLLMYKKNEQLNDGYDDRCSSYWGPGGEFQFGQVMENIAYFAMNLAMSLTYVIFIAAAVPVHLKSFAKNCFPSLIISAFTPCILDLPTMVLSLRSMLPAAVSPTLEMAWAFGVPFLYETVVGVMAAIALPLIAKGVMRLGAACRKK